MSRFYLLGVCALFAGCAHDVEVKQPSEILAESGYLVHVPPSALHGPGNIVYKRMVSGAPKNAVTLGYICDPQYIQFPGEPNRSGSEKIDFASNRNFTFSAKALEALGLSASASQIKSLTISFSNTEVLEYSLEGLQSIRSTLGPICTEIMRKQIASSNAYQVVGALKADITYRATLKNEAGATLSPEAIKEIAAEFGFKIESSAGRVGTGLYYGLDLRPVD